MRYSIFSAVLFSFIFATPQAQAGFEWLPPNKTTAITQEQAEMPEDSMGYGAPPPSYQAPQDTVAAPMPPVQAQPLDILPSYQPRREIPKAQAQQNREGSFPYTRLYINPYPLQAHTLDSNEYVEPASPTIERAMAEQSKHLNPLQLGAGMTTGVKPIASPQAEAFADHGVMELVPEPITGVTPLPVSVGPLMPLPGFEKARAPAAPMRQFANAVGFGQDLPLALALSQVIPSEFTPSFAKDVDPGAMVSWEGGMPWNEVLEEMLAPLGMTAVIQGDQVIIQRKAII